MSKLKVVFPSLLILCISSSFALEKTAHRPSLKLSNSVEISWPKNLKISSEFLPSFSAFSLSGEKGGKKFTGWISHKIPDVLANQTSVERIWKENQENAKKNGEVKSNDLGCKEVDKFIFKCEREAEIKAGEFIVDSLYWNEKKDIVFIRANSLVSAKDAREIFELFKVKWGHK